MHLVAGRVIDFVFCKYFLYRNMILAVEICICFHDIGS